MKLARQIFGALVVASPVLLAAWSSGKKNFSSHSSRVVRSGGSVPSDAGPAPFLTPSQADFQVTDTGNTLRIDFRIAKRMLRAANLDRRIWVFDSSDRGIHKLSEGKVVCAQHLGTRPQSPPGFSEGISQPGLQVCRLTADPAWIGCLGKTRIEAGLLLTGNDSEVAS